MEFVSHEKNGLGKICLRRIFIIKFIGVTRGSRVRLEFIGIFGREFGAYGFFSMLLNWRVLWGTDISPSTRRVSAGGAWFKSECEFVILSKLGMSELRSAGRDCGVAGLQGELRRAKDAASTYRLCPHLGT